MKKISALCLILIITASLVSCGNKQGQDESSVSDSTSATVSAEEGYAGEGTADSDTPVWETINMDDGTVYVSGYHGKDSVVEVPSEIGGKTVSGLSGQSFKYNEMIKEVVLPETVETISSEAFSQSSLEKIVLPDSLVYIGDYAFAICKNLKSVVIPEGVEHIGISAFSSCSSLKEITLNCKNLNTIPTQFIEYTLVDVFKVPDGVKTIEYWVSGNKNINAYIPESVIEMNSSFPSGEGVIIHGKAGSYAEEYAKSRNNTFVADYQ